MRDLYELIGRVLELVPPESRLYDRLESIRNDQEFVAPENENTTLSNFQRAQDALVRADGDGEIQGEVADRIAAIWSGRDAGPATRRST